MIDSDRECVEILQQMNAVLKALEAARQATIEDHLENCIGRAVADGRDDEALDELRKTLRLVLR
jgi:DNA-binding FrmR family transcriptional regulator